MPTCVPTRFLSPTGAHPANATPWLEPAPGDLDACVSPLTRTADAPRIGPAKLSHPSSCPVSRIGSPRTAFNPHTFTALAA